MLRAGLQGNPERGPPSSIFLNQFKSPARPAATESPAPIRTSADRAHLRRRRAVQDNPNEPVPWMQQLLDNPFMLLFLGVMVPMLLYTVWGVVDILTLPVAK
jgi:hypothetical protein